jgi:hypothetical protein
MGVGERTNEEIDLVIKPSDMGGCTSTEGEKDWDKL